MDSDGAAGYDERFLMQRHALSRILLSAAIGVGTLTAAITTSAGATTKKPAVTMYYVNLGDSYAMGYQPGTSDTTNGYAYQLVPLLAKAKHPMTLENFGCGGATTDSMINTVGCNAPATNGVPYTTTTQLAAALAFIAAHPGQIGLVTISIGGNDFDGCIGAADPTACITAAMPTMTANIQSATDQLRVAVGAKVPMMAITYPDVVLGLYRFGTAGQNLALLSVQLFKTIINPTFVTAYAKDNVTFIDVTAATGAYDSMSKMVKLAPYGKIPYPVAQVCSLTWFCEKTDIHPKTAGYTVIATLLNKAYAKITK